MAGPLIPYIDAPEIPFTFLQHVPVLGAYIDPASPPGAKPFGVLVAAAMVFGALLSMRRARQRGLDTNKLGDFIFWSVGIGFVVSHVFDTLAYRPEKVMENPLFLLKIWDGWSSYGGLIGGVFGAWVWGRYHKEDFLEFLDLCVSAFPLAWVFGRAGCAVVHDHPGALSNAWFAVRYPVSTLQPGFEGRFDLGLLEMVLTIPLAVACHWLWRRNPRRPVGFYLGLTITAYAPVRFLLDFLRVAPGDPAFGEADPRYLGLTPAQWACFVGLGLGLYWLKRTHGAAYVRTAPLAPKPDAKKVAKKVAKKKVRVAQGGGSAR